MLLLFANNIFRLSSVKAQMKDYMIIGQSIKISERISVNIFLSISFHICFGCSKERIIEMVLLSTHNICFG